VQFSADGKTYLVEPQLSMLGQRIPRLSALRYHPRYSVAWDGETISYYQHDNRIKNRLTFFQLAALVPEYLGMWGPFWLRNASKIPRIFWLATVRVIRSFRSPREEARRL
jgi:hypothetical protein